MMAQGAAASSAEHKLRQKFARGDRLDDRLKWSSLPAGMDIGGQNANQLTVEPAGRTDAWCRTYYRPEIVKDDVHLLGAQWSGDFSAQTRVRVDAVNQYDQAGFMVRFGPDNWLKAGLEYVDGKMRVSVVVTNEYSDWTTHGVREVDASITITVHRRGRQFVVEFGAEEQPKTGGSASIASLFSSLFMHSAPEPVPNLFNRTCELDTPAGGSAATRSISPTVGIYAAAPTAQGGSARFDYLIITKLLHHNMADDRALLSSAVANVGSK
mmetsp:Transcript_2259/g.6741  ORF Transcript_2259/g.6741 Transcript_2259/m.6741 type:complete len:268 (-) Transcript_2259:243-1046(-)